MEESSNFNDIVAKPLTEETSVDWFEWINNYLISQDLWKVTSRSARPQKCRVKDYARWRRKNAAALHVLRISCGPHNLPFIRGASEAKVAWDILYCTYHPPPPPPPPQEIVRVTEDIEMGILYKAISDNNWSAAKAFIGRYPIVLNVEFFAPRGETPLHVAARFGHVGIVEQLVRLVAPEYLEIYDALGKTPLIIAAEHSGVVPLAKCLITKNSKALAIPIKDYEWLIPVLLAFRAGLKEMGRYLYSVTPPQLFTENLNLGSSFLGTCLITGELDIVLDLLRRCKELLFAIGSTNFSTMEMIAFYLPDSRDKSQLPFWKRWVYYYIKIPSTTTTKHFYADHVQQDGENNKAHQGLSLLHRLISSINNLSGMKDIFKMKKQYAQATEILKFVRENVMFLNEENKAKTADALISAARAEKVDFLLQVTKANPELVSLLNFRQSYGHVFFDAVRRRRAGIFNLLRGFRLKRAVVTITKGNRNTLLHAATSLAPPSYLNHIPGAALQMQRELQWFKTVENMVDPAHRKILDQWQNPLDIFKENHKELRKEGERWMKDTANSCSVVGALIVTIMFSVAFIVPGGNDQASGCPIFLENKLFKVFLISDALSLFSSTTSVLTFLGILTSRYAVEDFLYSLPRKLIIGLSTLFLSIATMMVAFSVTIIIMLQHNSSLLRAFLPIAMLGGIPITLFVFLQFPLLVEVISSTYGPGIFKKKVEKWP